MNQLRRLHRAGLADPDYPLKDYLMIMFYVFHPIMLDAYLTITDVWSISRIKKDKNKIDWGKCNS